MAPFRLYDVGNDWVVTKNLHQSQQRLVECEGAVHPEPLKPTLSLSRIKAAQGRKDSSAKTGYCENEVQIGIFIDDRTLWFESAKKLQKLKEFVEKGDKADKVSWVEIAP